MLGRAWFRRLAAEGSALAIDAQLQSAAGPVSNLDVQACCAAPSAAARREDLPAAGAPRRRRSPPRCEPWAIPPRRPGAAGLGELASAAMSLPARSPASSSSS